MKYPNIFKPIILANQEVKNRIFMSPMGTGFEEQYGGGRVTTEMIDLYEARAKGGTALIVSPFGAVDERYFALTLGAYSRKILQGISRMAEVLKVYNCKFLLQLSHFGGKSPRFFTHGNAPIAPSSIESRMYPEVPLEMTVEQIEGIIDLYILAGIGARDAGCSGVELHGAHGYLINQFISPHSNKRNDDYGGTLEKRLFFLERIASGIRKQCGNDFIIGFKCSIYEAVEGGINTEIAKQVALHVEKQGLVDYFHASAFSTTLPGFLDSDFPSVPSIYIKPPLVPIAAEIKKVVSTLPIIATGGLGDPDFIEEIISDRQADGAFLGRALFADPEWVNKARNGDNIKICIKCNVCYKRVLNQQQVKCSINPYLGEERRFSAFIRGKTTESKKVVIVGAGPAGIEAGLTASIRGHEVILLEKGTDIGGNLRLAGIPEFKKEIKQLLDFYKTEISKSGIELKLNNNADIGQILGLNPDIVILAMGAKPQTPDIKGLGLENVFSSSEIFANDSLKLHNNIGIIGAGWIGCELGLYLLLKGHNVKLFDKLSLDDLMNDESPGNKYMLVRRLRVGGAEFYCPSDVIEIVNDGVIVKKEKGNMGKVIVDNVIIATGFESLNQEYLLMKNRLKELKPDLEIISAGDCIKYEKIYGAVNSGVQAAWLI